MYYSVFEAQYEGMRPILKFTQPKWFYTFVRVKAYTRGLKLNVLLVLGKERGALGKLLGRWGLELDLGGEYDLVGGSECVLRVPLHRALCLQKHRGRNVPPF